MRMKTTILAALLAAGLSGCGGGDDSPTVCRGTMANPDLCGSTATAAAATTSILAIYPTSITVGNCTTNIPFVFTGGTAPFTVFTSDNFRVPVSSPLPLAANSYFMASANLTAGGQPAPEALSPTFVLTVRDSQSKMATANVTVATVNHTLLACPVNPLLQLVSASQNARVTEILAFQIINGSGAYTFNFTDSTPNPVFGPTSEFAAVVSSSGTSVSVQANKAGTTLLTVTDTATSQKASIVFTIFPAP